MEHKIAAVSEKIDTWQSNYGEMKSYYVQFEGNTEAVKINQKPETPAPEVGQVLTGDIVADKFGKKFQKQAQGFSKPSVQNTPGKQIDHDSMYRCNALNNAVAFNKGDMNPEELCSVANVFYEWLEGKNKGYEAAKKTAESLKVEEKPEEKPDETFEGEEINLDDIPF